MDTGRFKFENYHGVLYVDACMNDELSLSDIDVVRSEIRKHFSPSTDVIWNKTGSYSVSAEVQMAAIKGIEEYRNVVYVADTMTKRESAKFAASSFMKPYNTSVAGSKEEAYALLSEISKNMLENENFQKKILS